MKIYNSRLQKLRKALAEADAFPFLILDLTNIRYLTGFNGSYGAVIIDGDSAIFISDTRYEEYAQSILPRKFSFILQQEDLFATVKAGLAKSASKRLFVEEEGMLLSSFTKLKKSLRGITCAAQVNPLFDIRMVKDSHELEILEKAGAITDDCVSHLTKYIQPGITEWDISVEIEYFYRKAGCRSTSFETIVASGPGASMPHYKTSMTKRINPGDSLLIDMGCIYEDYNSDLTRTFFIKSCDPEIEKIYSIVKTAQEEAIRFAKPGITSVDLDKCARSIIADAGFGHYFGHSLGHGFGLNVHEAPWIRPRGEVTLRKDMCLTIEPGIYLPGKGGVRIEDMVHITAKGAERMTHSTKEIIVL